MLNIQFLRNRKHTVDPYKHNSINSVYENLFIFAETDAILKTYDLKQNGGGFNLHHLAHTVNTVLKRTMR